MEGDHDRLVEKDEVMRNLARRRIVPSVSLMIFIVALFLVYNPLVNFFGEYLSFFLILGLCLVGFHLYSRKIDSRPEGAKEKRNMIVAEEIRMFGMKRFILENAIFLGIPAGIAMFVLNRYVFEPSRHADPLVVALPIDCLFGILFGVLMAYVQRWQSDKISKHARRSTGGADR